MSNSYAQPILRTADAGEALCTVARLLEVADTSELEVDYEAVVSSASALTRLLKLLPCADWWAEGGRGGSSQDGVDPVACLPVRVRSWGHCADVVVPLVRASGSEPAAVRWDFAGWPVAPEVGLGVGGSRGAFVTLCLNARDLDLEHPAADHTVFVHVKQVEGARAPWLAARVGQRVIGELVMAPY
ncbi:hypothetical protein AB0950_24975 [Streptomyces sp. NPDC007189]|uniref:hypothetical protein n=1 Tax=Streptomyces sp. NPDC007189 TaxID=3154315 RepID=UPI0034541263